MTTKRQQAASRRNGAKSRGPVTPAGKAKSARNATTHGLTAATFVLPCESNERFLALRDSVFQIYAPANEAELLLAKQIAGTMWQLERFASIDTHAVATQMDLTETQVREQFTELDPATHLTLAFLDLGNSSRSLQNLDRHQARLRRQLTHYRNELLAIQTIRRQKQKLQNEPGNAQAPHNQQVIPFPAPRNDSSAA
ncbi:MAG: hypothetical protein IT168_13165 [Bryobacterales bacterium]|nr:hypothetical protein [Bryobacterales bacterium]